MSQSTQWMAAARRTLSLEAAAIAALESRIDADFQLIVEQILANPGRLIFAGIGKSADVARKTVATLNSTGTPASFLHAADALHGDLGLVQDDDIVIAVSKSGNTAEVVALIPMIRARNISLIAMTGNPSSELATAADGILNVAVEAEACPHDLAPTTSSATQLAMGDALAIALMVARGFTPEQFAGFHPGGTLGRRLFLTLGDVLKTGGSAQTASSIPLDAPLDAVILGITAGRVGAVVVTENDRIAGIITDGDLRRAFKNMAKQADAPNNLLASELMTADPQTMDASELAAKGFSQMQSRKINQLVVTDGDQLAGVVHLHALISAGIF
ncbi:MAG: KpsF/GutQ family sugar-phosphate isomerase [Flavobacteriales bacterium]|nr:KpsF/GutQ family sugar-phosphate isomerase [Flavobacteriales bacterium]